LSELFLPASYSTDSSNYKHSFLKFFTAGLQAVKNKYQNNFQRKEILFRTGSVLTPSSFRIFSEVLREFWPNPFGVLREFPKNSARTMVGISKKYISNACFKCAKQDSVNH
jgi:hypothetical protein